LPLKVRSMMPASTVAVLSAPNHNRSALKVYDASRIGYVSHTATPSIFGGKQMHRIKIPGFTAEASLCATNGYFMHKGWPAIPAGGIIMQLRLYKIYCRGEVECIILDQMCSVGFGGMTSEPGGGAACNVLI
jgi:hypothetical protein